uniref:Uncharacterized protein n=1 Tax=viral metagenome TaxID=1070528 RepID=A0A6C0E6K6_9ZZZZ
MTLTRNLYEMDEVVAALQQGLREGSPDAHFWLWELLVSKEEAVANKALDDVWLWSGRGSPLTLPLGPQKFAIVRAACYPVTTVADTPTKRREQRIAQFTQMLPAQLYTEAAEFWVSLDSACRRYAKAEAVGILRACRLQPAAIWMALRIATRGPAAPYVRDMCDRLEQAGADPISIVLILCEPASSQFALLENDICSHIARDWAAWDALCGRRKVRRPIPAAALHKGTTRGSMSSKYTNIVDVREPLWLLPNACRWWREIYVTYTPETHDDFHDKYFPDDIPDEWSETDQQMSHGQGCAETALPAPIKVDVATLC